MALWTAAIAAGLTASPVSAKTVRIVAFGDSNTYGYGTDRRATYPAQLDTLLRARGHDVKVANAGLNGDMTADALSRLDKAFPPGTDAAIVFIGRNDWRKGTPAVTISHNLETIVGWLRQRDIEVLLVGFRPNDFSAIARKFDALYYPDFFDGTMMILGRKKGKYRLDNDLGAHLNADGYAVVVNRMLPTVEKLIARVSD